MKLLCSKCSQEFAPHEVKKLPGVSAACVCPSCGGPCFPDSGLKPSKMPSSTGTNFTFLIVAIFIIAGIVFGGNKILLGNSSKRLEKYKVELVAKKEILKKAEADVARIKSRKVKT